MFRGLVLRLKIRNCGMSVRNLFFYGDPELFNELLLSSSLLHRHRRSSLSSSSSSQYHLRHYHYSSATLPAGTQDDTMCRSFVETADRDDEDEGRRQLWLLFG